MLHRIFAVFYKDFKWALFNPKLLMLILMPLLLSFFFQVSGKGGLLGFSLVFTYTFIGCFLCSYMIVEEKKIDSLKCVLLTPLSATELLIGKFLLPLSLCLLFSFVTLSIAQKTHLFFNVVILMSLVLMSAIICFSGLFLGLISKNEQEPGIVGPAFMLIFLSGISQIKEQNLKYAGYFPDFHMTHLIENVDILTTQQLSLHLLFLLLFFIAMLLLVSTYIQYFFSTDLNSKRINLKSILMICPVVLVLTLSGITAEEFSFKDTKTNLVKKEHILSFDKTLVTVPFDNVLWRIAIIKTDDMEMLTLTSKKNPQVIKVSLRKLTPDEMSIEDRLKKIEKEKLTILSKLEYSSPIPDFTQVIYFNEMMEYRTTFEWQCEKTLLIFSFTHPNEAPLYKKYLSQVKALIQDTTKNCESLPQTAQTSPH